MANIAINEFLVSKGITSTTLSTNIVRLGWLAIVGPLAIWFLGTIEFLIAISLAEYFAYSFLIIRLKQLNVIIWQKEVVIALSLVFCLIAAFVSYFYRGII